MSMVSCLAAPQSLQRPNVRRCSSPALAYVASRRVPEHTQPYRHSIAVLRIQGPCCTGCYCCTNYQLCRLIAPQTSNVSSYSTSLHHQSILRARGPIFSSSQAEEVCRMDRSVPVSTGNNEIARRLLHAAPAVQGRSVHRSI